MKYAKPLEWSAGTSYKRGDIVTYKNIYYTCAADHTSSIGAPPYTDLYEGAWVKAGSNYNVYPSVRNVMPFIIGQTKLAVDWFNKFETWYNDSIADSTEQTVYKVNKYESTQAPNGYDYTINDIGILAFVVNLMHNTI